MTLSTGATALMEESRNLNLSQEAETRALLSHLVCYSLRDFTATCLHCESADKPSSVLRFLIEIEP